MTIDAVRRMRYVASNERAGPERLVTQGSALCVSPGLSLCLSVGLSLCQELAVCVSDIPDVKVDFLVT